MNVAPPKLQLERINHELLSKAELHRIAPKSLGCAQSPTQLRQRPPQRSQWIVRIPEQQRRQTVARDGQLGQRDIRQHGPGLPPARRGRTHPPELDLGMTQQPHHYAAAHSTSIERLAGTIHPGIRTAIPRRLMTVTVI